jgi:hypothetical protein
MGRRRTPIRTSAPCRRGDGCEPNSAKTLGLNNLRPMAGEYFLESQSIFETAAFTWSPEEEDFTDRLTQATREEFDDPDFNPVPARRRLRAKQG